MITPPAPARIFGHVAAEADVCVLLRRGPSKWVLMVRWDLATDEFEIGQWLKARVYEFQSDLSPDGKLLAYQALDAKWASETGGAYAAVSRPPYFKALALWSHGYVHGGGFRWARPKPAFLHGRRTKPTKGFVPERYAASLRSADPTEAAIERGWSVEGFDRPRLVRATKQGCLAWRLGNSKRPTAYWLDDEPLDAQWADIDHKSRLLLARDGRIYVRDADGEHELIDLNHYEFRPLEAPEWAKRWPE